MGGARWVLGGLALGVAALAGCAVPEARAQGAARATVERCAGDAECGWDDGCLPTRCVRGGVAGPVACDESSPPPGDCRCRAGRCTLERRDLASTRSAERGCRGSQDCALDAERGQCRVAPAALAAPARDGDRYCDCEPATQRCVQRIYEPVPCQSYRDCSWAPRPLRAVPAREVPRRNPRPVRPCRDGEIDSVCREGRCAVVAWEC